MDTSTLAKAMGNAPGGSTTVTGPTVVEVNRRSTSTLYDPSFVGTVYWWEVD